MKRVQIILLSASICALLLMGCRRNYQVVHAYPPIDSLVVAGDSSMMEENTSEEPSWEDEPLIEVPDAPQEEDFTNVSNATRKEYDDYIHGR